MGSTLRRGPPDDRHSLLHHDVSAANSGREVPVYLWFLFLLPIVVAQTCTTGACFSNSILARALAGCGCWLTVDARVWAKGTVSHFAVWKLWMSAFGRLLLPLHYSASNWPCSSRSTSLAGTNFAGFPTSTVTVAMWMKTTLLASDPGGFYTPFSFGTPTIVRCRLYHCRCRPCGTYPLVVVGTLIVGSYKPRIR